MSGITYYPDRRRGIMAGRLNKYPLIYGGTEPVAMDAPPGMGKFSRFIGENLVSPRTGLMSKIITDPKDAEQAWASWRTLADQGYKVLFINPLRLYGFPSESFNLFTSLLELASQLELVDQVWDCATDVAGYLVPLEPDSLTSWIGNDIRTAFGVYLSVTSRFRNSRWTCTPGGLWDFFGRSPEKIHDTLMLWSHQGHLQDVAGMCRLVAGWTKSPNQWNALSSTISRRLQSYQTGSALRKITESNSFDPATMKHQKTALFIIGSTTSQSSRAFVGSMTAAVIDRIAGVHGPLRTLIVGDEWGQLYVSNFEKILTLYRAAGINLIAAFQNAPAQIEARYGKEVGRIWKKAVANTLYMGLPDAESLRDIEHRSGKTSVLVRGFNVTNQQVNGSGDTWSEQSRPLLQVENIRRATSGGRALLDSRDHGFSVVDMPNFWELPEMAGMLRDVRLKPDPYEWLKQKPLALPAPMVTTPQEPDDSEILAILKQLEDGRKL